MAHDPGGRVRLRLPPDTRSAAGFSPCGRYRTWLERRWDGAAFGSGGHVAFIGMNPSTADEEADDPTVAGCMARARAWGFGAAVMLNAFAYRATDKRRLLEVADPIGPGNDEAILYYSARAALVIAAWGRPPAPLAGRGAELAEALRRAGIALMCLATNADGSPRHPLYVRRDAIPRPWPG
ncbi:MAG: DUF1643 domain-containing protein [Rhodovarius sp.]|nr:DUF1643 domain-containing protein [Rhodovarius sp.]